MLIAVAEKPVDISNWFQAFQDRKKLDGAKLHGAKFFQKNCQNVPGAAGAAAGAAAAPAAASAAFNHVILRGREAPP